MSSWKKTFIVNWGLSSFLQLFNCSSGYSLQVWHKANVQNLHGLLLSVAIQQYIFNQQLKAVAHPTNKTDFKKVIKREVKIAFSKKVQSIWVRILKYILLLLLIYFFRNIRLFWIIFFTTLILALIVHFWARYKTKGWTKSYGLWKYDKHNVDIPEDSKKNWV